MSGQDRVRWDEVYREMAQESYPPPDPALLKFVPPLDDREEEHRALDLAAGMGQNGLWLAAQGYIVDVMDVSRVGLLRAQAEAAARGLRNLNLLTVDLDQHKLKTDHYDMVCVFRYLKRDMFIPIRQSVRPGGRVIYETFNTRYLNIVPGFNPSFLLEIGELAGYFSDWKIIHQLEETHISRLVAVRPEDELLDD